MDGPASARRRRSQVFVEIPPSPLHSARSTMGQRASQPTTPFKTVPMNVDSLPSPPTSSASLKRKSPDASHDMSMPHDEHQPPKAKKPKTENAPKQDSTAQKTTKALSASEHTGPDKSQANDGRLRCHQCARLFDPSGKNFPLPSRMHL